MLQTLGSLQLKESDFHRQKPLLLLCFLALEGVKARRYLAELFFMEGSSPLNSLSRALSHLRGIGPELIGADLNTVWARVDCDAKRLLAELEQRNYATALELYQGPFLATLDIDLNEELEEWVLLTRELLAERVREAYLRLGEEAATKGNFNLAAQHAESAYHLPGAAELEPEDFERVYALLMSARNPLAADIRKEASSFGIQLLLSSEEAQSRFKTNTEITQHNLPRRRTSFVGRHLELEAIANAFSDPRRRLLSLLGPGGIGKSRLAIEAAYDQLRENRFRDGIFFVSLDSLSSASLIPGVIAEALKLDLQSQESVLAQVKNYLDPKALLLILDNFEHLVSGATLIPELLSACPQLGILTTTRERLNLEDEWVLSIDGLPSSSQTQGSEALELFVQRAKRAQLSFALTNDELPHALAICEMVGGSPLAIELAATWIKLLPPAEIAREIKQQLSFLTTPYRDVAKRHHSIEAAFEYSWQLLSETEQIVLRKLAVFRGGFRKEAALEVAGGNLSMLAALVNKSLLKMTPNGRYERHALLYEFTRAKLKENAAEAREVQEKQLLYFHDFLQNLATKKQKPTPDNSLSLIEEELENLRTAWHYAIATTRYQELQTMAFYLRNFFSDKGRLQEGIELFREAMTSLEPMTPINQNTLGTLLIEQACLLYRVGDFQKAEVLVLQGLELIQTRAGKAGLDGLLLLGALNYYAGRFLEAREQWENALELSKHLSESEGIKRSLNYLAIAEEQLRNLDKAEGYFKQALSISREDNDKTNLALVLHNFAIFKINHKDFEPAKTLLEEGLALASEVGMESDIPHFLKSLAKAVLHLGDHERARKLAEESLRLAKDAGEQLLEALNHLEILGKAALASEHYAEAQTHYARGLDLAQSINAVPLTLEALMSLAELNTVQKSFEKAALLLSFVSNQSTLPVALHTQLTELKTKLGKVMNKRTLATIQKKAEALSLQEAIRLTLKQAQ